MLQYFLLQRYLEFQQLHSSQNMEVQINAKPGYFELMAMFGSHSIDHFNTHDASSLKRSELQSEVYIAQLVLISLFTVQNDSISCNLCVTTVKEYILTQVF